MKKIKPIIIVVLIVAALTFVKLYFFTSKTPSVSSTKGGNNAAVSVTAYIAKHEYVNEKINTSGTLLANKEVMLVPETSGKIISINFNEGTIVSKGDLLVKINDADLQAQLKKLKLQEQLAFETATRHKKMLEAGGVSQEEYDVALTNYNSIKAETELLSAQIAKTEIRAPFQGKIGLLNVYEGSYVNQASAVAVIQQLSPLKVDFHVSEKYASSIKPGQAFTFTVAGDTSIYNASVSAIEPGINVNTRTLHVRGVFQNNNNVLFPGLYANIEYPVASASEAILVPTQALIPILKGQKLFISENGKAKEVIVKTGIRTDKNIQITNGVKPGDTVIVTGIMQLKPGVPINFTSVK